MVVNHQLYKKDIFFPDWFPSPFLVLIVEFFLKTKKTGFFAQCHESDIFAFFVVFWFCKFRYDGTKDRPAASCPALPDAKT